MRERNTWDVVIVGGGASGTLLAANLVKGARGPLRVALVERTGSVGRGLAYSTRSARHLLNVPAARMGAFPDDPEHFLRWARREAPETAPGQFVERRRYARYLDDVLREAVRDAAPGVQFEVIGGEGRSLATADGGARLTLASGEVLEARRVVLALGNAAPANLPVPDGGLYGSPRYHRSPWAEGALEGVGPEDAVLLVGTGLTMVDAALSLEERGHRGVIHALSRHGLLPHVHRNGPVKPPSSTYVAPGIRDVLRALRAEVERGPGHPIPVRVRAMLRVMRKEVALAEGLGTDWRAVVDALRPATVPLWRRLPLEERRRFLRHLRAHWEVHRHRMAPGIGEAVARLQTEGRLRLHAGRVRGFQLEGEDVVVRWRPRGQGAEEVMRVRHVVNCTGPDSAITARSHPLLHALLTSGLSRPDDLGIGLATAEGGALLDASGRASEALYTLGPPRRGDLWETTAVPEIRAQARALAERLLGRRPAA